MATFASMAGRVLIHVPGAPQFLIEDALRAAAIDLCKRSKCYRKDVAATLDAAAFPYTVVPPADTAVVKVLEVKPAGAKALDETDVREAGLAHEDWRTRTGTLAEFIELARGILRLVPLPEAATAFTLTAALEPTQAAPGIDDAVYLEHRDTIISGGIYRLAMMPNKAWTNADIALTHKGLFDAGVADAVRDFTLNYVMPVRRTAPSPL